MQGWLGGFAGWLRSPVDSAMTDPRWYFPFPSNEHAVRWVQWYTWVVRVVRSHQRWPGARCSCTTR